MLWVKKRGKKKKKKKQIVKESLHFVIVCSEYSIMSFLGVILRRDEEI